MLSGSRTSVLISSSFETETVELVRSFTILDLLLFLNADLDSGVACVSMVDVACIVGTTVSLFSLRLEENECFVIKTLIQHNSFGRYFRVADKNNISGYYIISPVCEMIQLL